MSIKHIILSESRVFLEFIDGLRFDSLDCESSALASGAHHV